MKYIITWILFLGFNFSYAQPDVDFVQIASGFDRPVDITHANDSSKRLFIVEKPGSIKIIDLEDNTVLPDNFLNIRSRVDDGSNEQGLLGLAFHPNYESNGQFFVNYIFDPGPGLDRTRISRFTVSDDPNLADENSEVILLEIDQDFGNHNGGCIKFGPDGYLYIGMGDGGSGGDPNCRAQDPQELLGKMLRIDVDGTPPGNTSEMCGLLTNYGIPPDNPFVSTEDGVCDEIWAVGLRNPWRFSFDAIKHDLWIGDVGQNIWEEIDFQPASSTGGENYGWKVMEASSCFDNDPIDPDCPVTTPSCFDNSFVAPVFEFDHSDGCSVTGGFVYRGATYPTMHGYYIFIDYCTSILWTMIKDNDEGWQTTSKVLQGYGNITTFGEDQDLELYAASDGANSGAIYKVIDKTSVSIEALAADEKWSFYPNPTDTVLRISPTGPETIKIDLYEVYNLSGQKVLEHSSHEKNSNQYILDTNSLKKGIHFLMLHAQDKRYLYKFIKI